MGSPLRNRRVGRIVTFLAVCIVANSFGNLLLFLGMNHVPAFGTTPFTSYVAALAADPFLIPGAALAALAALVQLSMFSWADLSYVVPCTALSYVLSTFLAEFVLGEHVQWMRWLGVALIFVGVAFVFRTPVATKPHGQETHSC